MSAKEVERLGKALKEKILEEENLRNRINHQEKELLKRESMDEELINCEGKVTVMKVENDRLNNILEARTTEL